MSLFNLNLSLLVPILSLILWQILYVTSLKTYPNSPFLEVIKQNIQIPASFTGKDVQVTWVLPIKFKEAFLGWGRWLVFILESWTANSLQSPCNMRSINPFDYLTHGQVFYTLQLNVFLTDTVF